MHSLNFALGVGEYREQLEAMANELAGHRGPMIVAGDFNTWNATRVEVLDAVTQRLGVVSVVPALDTRSRFFGRQVDYFFVRGLEVVNADAPHVQSSDNPLRATLRVADSLR